MLYITAFINPPAMYLPLWSILAACLFYAYWYRFVCGFAAFVHNRGVSNAQPTMAFGVFLFVIRRVPVKGTAVFVVPSVSALR